MAEDEGAGLTSVLEMLLATVDAVRRGEGEAAQLLEALTALRVLREAAAGWEPELIAAARSSGVSWGALAPVLGVASRQAAERRYLRIQPSATGEVTGEGRVGAERDRRAGDRAVATWARQNSAVLRQLAGRVSAAAGLDALGQDRADRVGVALGNDNAADLLGPLEAARPYLLEHHGGLAEEVESLARHTDHVRRDAAQRRGKARE